MAQIRAQYADLLGELVDEYVRYTPASALFYRDHDHHKTGLRIESIELMKEFVSDINFGKDPEGLLFYNEKSDFTNIDDPVIYKVYYNDEEAKAIKVEFYYSEEDPDPFTTFLARDSSVPPDVLKDGTGKWHNLKIAACSADLRKYSAWSTVTLSIESIGKRVSFKVKKDMMGRAIRTHGTFGFSRLTHLTGNDCVASYNDDRILFSSKSHRSQILAVFFPTNGRVGINDHDDPDPPTATWEDL